MIASGAMAQYRPRADRFFGASPSGIHQIGIRRCTGPRMMTVFYFRLLRPKSVAGGPIASRSTRTHQFIRGEPFSRFLFFPPNGSKAERIADTIDLRNQAILNKWHSGREYVGRNSTRGVIDGSLRASSVSIFTSVIQQSILFVNTLLIIVVWLIFNE